eukprot:scaffold3648_cov149-Amphora_coffeaeformis.AAC.11
MDNRGRNNHSTIDFDHSFNSLQSSLEALKLRRDMEDSTARTEDSDCVSDFEKVIPRCALHKEAEPVATPTDEPLESTADDADAVNDTDAAHDTAADDKPLQRIGADIDDEGVVTPTDQPSSQSTDPDTDAADEDDDFEEEPVVASAHQPLQRVDEDEESDSELTTEGEYNFDIEHSSSSHGQSLSHSLTLQTHSLHSKASGHSRGSQTSNGSLKIFRKPADWKNSGHDSLSFLEPFDNEFDESENAADEDDLRVLCSRDSKRLKLLGEGAFGQVWLVRHNHKSYALKVASKYDLLTEGAVHELVREREIMSQLDHPFIARLWATNQDHDFVYILEDYLAGGELFSVLERAGDAACIADALGYLHKKHIIYRDLKPENVMLDKRGFPTLIDFGCSKQLTAEDGYQTRTLCGTPRFASPEMVDPASFGGGHGIGTDHWALGILVYEMLAGGEPSWKALMDLGAPEVATDLIQKLLIKNPVERLGAESEDQVMKHAWLVPINVRGMGRVQAPWVPDLTDPTDTQYFDDWEDQVEDRFAQTYPSLTEKEEAHFAEF